MHQNNYACLLAVGNNSLDFSATSFPFMPTQNLSSNKVIPATSVFACSSLTSLLSPNLFRINFTFANNTRNFFGWLSPNPFPFFLIYEAFASVFVFVSFSCFGFNHSSSEKLQSLVSLAQRSGCFFFASS